MKLSYSKLKMQKYLKGIKNNITVEEAQMIFKLRSRMADVKVNFRNKYEVLECDICKAEEQCDKSNRNCTNVY
jgi:hypothetical protein